LDEDQIDFHYSLGAVDIAGDMEVGMMVGLVVDLVVDLARPCAL
jgi:hypothetical protein